MRQSEAYSAHTLPLNDVFALKSTASLTAISLHNGSISIYHTHFPCYTQEVDQLAMRMMTMILVQERLTSSSINDITVQE